MRKIFFVFLLTSAINAGAQWKEKLNSVDSALTYLYQRQLFNGTVLLAENGKVIYNKAFGIAGADGKPLTTSSAFNLASVSKQFFTMMTMILKEQGKLQYDDPVQKYLPSFPYPQITLRHLMNHTSGLPEYFDIAENNMNLLDTLDNESMLALLAAKKPALVFPTGDKFEYCNTNYTTLASVIATVSGVSCDKFFEEKIAKPLKLKNTYIYNIKMKSYPSSRVFGFHYEGGKPVPDDLLSVDGIVGDGNVYSSTGDLYKWDRALYTEKLVKKATFLEAITPAKLNNDSLSDYGFGWFIEKPGVEVAHSGGWVAFGTYIDRFIATNKTFILLDNSANYAARGIVKNIIEGKPLTLPETQLITNVQLIDGTGAAARKASVRIVNNRIKDIGDLTAFAGETVIDGKGNVLAPGFIDTHSHHEWGLQDDPGAIAVTNQGVTTIVTGQDGGSWPIDSLRERLTKHPVSVNVLTYTGHASLREKVMKEDLYRKANSNEIAEMKKLLDEELAKGSLGLSTGLEYEEGFYSTREEVIELAKTTAAVGGRYISHLRSEDINLENAIDEIVAIGREAKIPVQISHFKIAMRSKWGSSSTILARLNAARADGINITADCYPYTMWSSTPRVLFPKKDFTSEASAEFATKELFDPATSVMTHYPANKKYEGKTVKEIGQINNESASRALLRLIREGEKEGSGSIAGVSMSEDDIANFLKWSNTNICSDGSYGGHPRGFGAFTRVLGRYVREKKVLTLEEAVYKMTGLAAEHIGLKYRGTVARNYFADLVLFNPNTVIDNSTMTNPHALSTGIEIVWVNGKIVYRDQKATGEYPGTFVTR